MFWIVLALILAGLAAVPVWVNSRRQPADKSHQDQWPGSSIALPQGPTRYRWIGGVRGPVIVAVHGLTSPSTVWDSIAEDLTGIGYRVLVYDLYGRGGSANGGRVQDTAFHVRQLRDLLDALGLADELIIMGYSMGGQIAAAFAAEAPDRVQRLILLAAAGIDMTESSFDRFCRRWPVLGDWAHTVLGTLPLARGAKAAATGPGASPAVGQAIEVQLTRRGYLEAVLASRRGALDGPKPEIYQGLARTGLPVLAIWGEADTVIPISAMGQLAQWIRNARQETIKDAGHDLVYARPDEVAALLKGMLLEAR